MKIISGEYNAKNRTLNDSSENIKTYEDDEFIVSIYGEVTIDNKTDDFDVISSYYKKYTNEITKYIFGVYILVIYDKINNKLAVFHDRTTSPITLYYTYDNDILYYSTSLKRLLLTSKINRKLNENVIEDFMINGFLYGDQTLLENIYKIKSFHCLNVDENGASQVEIEYCFTDYDKEYSFEHFKSVLDKAIVSKVKDLTEVNAPLSSGYDSSYIVNVLSNDTDLPINAFSIGGKFGKNELPIVEKNYKEFKRTKLFSKLTDSDTLQNYPDIVWRLDGNVYESGLFLQYELNKLVSEHGKTSLICGECADQVLNVYYFNEERNRNKTAGEAPKYYEFSDYPYIFGSYLILKKNGIMANSFDVETRYPFLDNDFIAICKPLGEYNGKTKRYHKENCQKCLPKSIIDNISKIGGSTECHSLFNNEEEIKRFVNYVEKSKFFKTHKDLIKKHSYNEKIKPSMYIRLKTVARNIVYAILRKNIDKSSAYFNEEMKLKEYLNYTFIILFDELFISGKYDKDFKEKEFSNKLNYFM